MTIPLYPDFRLKVGTHTAAAILADASSRVRYWPTTLRRPWTVGWTLAEPFTSVREGLNGTRRGFGLINFEWTIAKMNGAMLDYLRDEIFPDGILTNEAVTAHTVGKGWYGEPVMITVNCSVSWDGLQRERINPQAGGVFSNVRLQFFNGVIAASGA